MSGFANEIDLLFRVISSVGEADSNITSSQCEETIDHYSFYQGFLIPAILITLSFGFTKQRKMLFLEILNGRPGMVFPMDILTRDTSMSYAAAFGATLHLVLLVIFEQKVAFVTNGPPGIKSLVVIASMLIYGMVFFPVFACLAIRSTYGYIMGSLYIWFFTALSIFQIFQCAYAYERNTMIALVCRSIPQFVCLMYLCISLPGRFIEAFRTKKNIFETISDDYVSETLSEIKESYVGRHVRKLFVKPKHKEEPPEEFKEKVKAKLKSFWHRWVYKMDDGFEYSSRFQSVMFVGVLLIYMLAFETFVQGIALFRYILLEIENSIEKLRQDGSPVGDIEFLSVIYYFCHAFQISFILAIVFTICISLVAILHTVTSYRKNLRDLHKGIHTHIPPMSKRSNASILVGSIRYAGYQVGYIAWGYVIQASIFFLISLLLSTLIILLHFGIKDWFIDFLIWAWPIVLSAIVINVLQILLAKFLFLQEKGTHLAFENRRMLFFFTYFMFFYNIFLGLVSCLMRIIKAIVLGALFLSRLDNSTLPERFQFFDPGFAAYVGFMHIENSHNHPVVLVFVRILLASRRTKLKSALVGISKIPVCNLETGIGNIGHNRTIKRNKQKAARFNWHVTYTLIHNPELRLERKGYLQALRRAKLEGLAVPVSDNFTTDTTFFIEQKKPQRTHKMKDSTV